MRYKQCLKEFFAGIRRLKIIFRDETGGKREIDSEFLLEQLGAYYGRSGLAFNVRRGQYLRKC